MDAKEYLNQIEKYNWIISNTMEEMVKYREIATSTGVPPEVGISTQIGGKSDRVGQFVAKYVDTEQKLQSIIDEATAAKLNILNTISLLDAKEYRLLHIVYVQGKLLKEAEIDFEKSRTWVSKLHRKALKDLQEILDRRT